MAAHKSHDMVTGHKIAIEESRSFWKDDIIQYITHVDLKTNT